MGKGKKKILDPEITDALSALTAAGKVRLPTRKGGVKPFKGVSVKGRSIVETMIEDRR